MEETGKLSFASHTEARNRRKRRSVAGMATLANGKIVPFYFGKWSVKQLPFSFDLTEIFPLCRSIICRVMLNPMPDPFGFVV